MTSDSTAAQVGRAARYGFFLLLPLATAGAGSFAAPLWLSSARHHVPGLPRRGVLALVALLLAAGVVGGWTCVALSPEDAAGEPVGPLVDIGVLLLLATTIAGIAVALVWRAALLAPSQPPVPAVERTPTEPAPVRQARARRERRAQYRALALDDPALALELRVGRPDLPEPLDDGGLVDVNRVPAACLVEHAELTAGEAEQVVRARERLHGLRSVDELVVHTDLGPAALERLRGCAVFLPPLL